MALANAITELLTELITEMDDENTVGFALGGSYARGEATPYSDIDFSRFVKKPITDYTRHYYLYRRDFVIEVANIPLEPAWKDLTKPAQAIWFVPALRQLLILQDKEGEIKKLRQAAMDFEWLPLQETANQYASYLLHERVETVHKLIKTLKNKGTEAELQRPASLLTEILTHLVAVQRGILIKTANTYYQQVQESVGLQSNWTRYQLVALGIASNTKSTWAEQAVASLQLYLETVTFLQAGIRSQDRVVIDYTIAFIKQFLDSL